MSFWANAINGVQNEAPPAPVQRGLYNYGSPIPQHYQYQPPQQDYTPSVRMTQGSICPGCGSDNYLPHPPGQPDRSIACAECGFHPRFMQSGYGTPSLKSQPGQLATPARQYMGGQTMQQSIAVLNAGGGERI